MACPAELDNVALPVKSAPLRISTRPLLSEKATSPGIETPLRAPPLLVKSRSAPPLRVMLPPVMDPPASLQEPVVGVSASVLELLFGAPVGFTVPPERTKWARFTPPVVNVPPKFKVEALRLIVAA